MKSEDLGRLVRSHLLLCDRKGITGLVVFDLKLQKIVYCSDRLR